MAIDFMDARFTAPICTVRDVAELVGMPLTTVQSWAGQRHSRPQLITRIPPERRGWPSIPLVGLAEAATLRGLLGILPRKEVWAAADWIRQRFDTPHALANEKLVTDGAYAYVEEHPNSIYRVATNQHVIRSTVEEYLRPVRFAEDFYPEAFRVNQLPGVEINPHFNAGRMAFERNRVPVFAVAGSLRAGETVAEVIEEYQLTRAEVRAVERQLDWLDEAA